jgi:putative transposase
VPVSVEDLQRMRWLDEQYTAPPLYGSRRMTAWLRRQGYAVKHKRVGRLMRQMGLEAIDAKPRLSQPAEGHEISPYLLRGVTVSRAHQVWSADITYSRLRSGLVSLVAVMDWCSRFVLSWAMSITMDGALCVEALDRALVRGRPEIFNTDQGAQFTSRVCTARLKEGGVQISMDGLGRALDKVSVERLWRTVKSEEVYLRDDQPGRDAWQGLGQYFAFYNQERLHPALAYRTPAAVYGGIGEQPLPTDAGAEVQGGPRP